MTPSPLRTRHVQIPVDHGSLDGVLARPANARGLVVFAHGSGSSRHSARNQHVANVLHEHGFATLLWDLLTQAEAREDDITAEHRFDIELLTSRVRAALAWTRAEEDVRELPVGLFGASTGSAAALAAAAHEPRVVAAVVSRGGRPDLAGELLSLVRAPTLLLVGGRDVRVRELNEQAARALQCEHEVSTVAGATHLFEEPGTLDRVAQRAAAWFDEHLERAHVSPPSESAARSEGATVRGRARRTPLRRSGPYEDRAQAGAILADAVRVIADELEEPMVVALPRGGVPVAVPVARALDAPLEISVARKVGVPGQPEFALGAVDEDGESLVDARMARRLGLDARKLRLLVAATEAQVRRRVAELRDGHAAVPVVAGRDVLLVDDGYATGMTARVVARYLRRHGARTVTLAVPVAPDDLLDAPPEEFDRVVCPYAPENFRAVGLEYRTFDQVATARVRRLLDEAAAERRRSAEA